MKLAFALNIAFVEDLSTIIENQVNGISVFARRTVAEAMMAHVAAVAMAMAVSVAASLRVSAEMA